MTCYKIKRVTYRDVKTGRFVSEKYVRDNPDANVVMTEKTVYRDPKTGRFFARRYYYDRENPQIPSGAVNTIHHPVRVVSPEEQQRSDRIHARFEALNRMIHMVIDGHLPALVVSGPPGLGKSYGVGRAFQERGYVEISGMDQETIESMANEKIFDVVSGTITSVKLYIALWNLRNGGILFIDDTDNIFRDETCMNLLKAVLDSSETRRVSYRKRAHWMDEMGIPNSFDFKGSVIFSTNLDFEDAIAKGNTMSAHYSALIDRSLYLSLTMRTREDFLCRIRHIAIENGMLEKVGLTVDQAQDAMQFVEDNADRFYSLSLRLMHQIADCMLADPDNWRDDIEATKMRTI